MLTASDKMSNGERKSSNPKDSAVSSEVRRSWSWRKREGLVRWTVVVDDVDFDQLIKGVPNRAMGKISAQPHTLIIHASLSY